MDPVSHFALGAAAALSLAKPATARWAALTGGLAALLADADVLIQSDADPLLNVEFHRHFSHSLIFIPIGGAVAAAALWLFLRRRMSFGALYLSATIGYGTAGLLDACTSYGTHLLWPFSDARASWSVISIVDPVFTLGLALLAGIGWVKRRSVFAKYALLFALTYLGFGWLQNTRASAAQAELAASRGHSEVEMATVKPTIGNLILWRSVYRHNGIFYVDAVRVGYFSLSMTYPGSSAPALDLDSFLPGIPSGSALTEDLRRFAHFSDGYIVVGAEDPNLIVDLRYSPLPHRLDPLWAIRIQPEQPERRADFETFRNIGPDERAELVRMLKGNPSEP